MLTISQNWEGGNLFYPYVFKDDDTWVMFYSAYENGLQSTATGVATSADGIHWIKSDENPILTPTSGSTYDSVYTSCPSVIRDDYEYKLYYAGRIDKLHKYYSIGLATVPLPEPKQSITILILVGFMTVWAGFAAWKIRRRFSKGRMGV